MGKPFAQLSTLSESSGKARIAVFVAINRSGSTSAISLFGNRKQGNSGTIFCLRD
jgi:hypothetical protein